MAVLIIFPHMLQTVVNVRTLCKQYSRSKQKNSCLLSHICPKKLKFISSSVWKNLQSSWADWNWHIIFTISICQNAFL